MFLLFHDDLSQVKTPRQMFLQYAKEYCGGEMTSLVTLPCFAPTHTLRLGIASDGSGNSLWIL